MHPFIQKLKSLEDSGMSRAEIARRADEPKTSISAWLNGKHVPGEEKQTAVLKKLGLIPPSETESQSLELCFAEMCRNWSKLNERDRKFFLDVFKELCPSHFKDVEEKLGKTLGGKGPKVAKKTVEPAKEAA